MRRSPVAVTLVKKYGKHMLVSHGPLDEERTSSSASANITPNDWTLRERKDAELREVFE
jgi:hypothetical protein